MSVLVCDTGASSLCFVTSIRDLCDTGIHCFRSQSLSFVTHTSMSSVCACGRHWILPRFVVSLRVLRVHALNCLIVFAPDFRNACFLIAMRFLLASLVTLHELRVLYFLQNQDDV